MRWRPRRPPLQSKVKYQLKTEKKNKQLDGFWWTKHHQGNRKLNRNNKIRATRTLIKSKSEIRLIEFVNGYGVRCHVHLESLNAYIIENNLLKVSMDVYINIYCFWSIRCHVQLESFNAYIIENNLLKVSMDVYINIYMYCLWSSASLIITNFILFKCKLWTWRVKGISQAHWHYPYWIIWKRRAYISVLSVYHYLTIRNQQ